MQPPQVGWLSFTVPAVASIVVVILAWWLPRRDVFGSAIAAAQDHVFKTQQAIIEGLRVEVKEMRARIVWLEDANRECMAQNDDMRDRIKDLERAVRALGGQ